MPPSSLFWTMSLGFLKPRLSSVISFDFTKAYVSVRLSNLFAKLCSFPLPDFLFNWLIQFFANRSHSTLYNGLLSTILRISASIVQGLVRGPFVYVDDSSDL